MYEEYKDKYPEWFDEEGNYVPGSIENRIERIKDRIREEANKKAYGQKSDVNVEELQSELSELSCIPMNITEEKVKALFFRSEIPKVINTYGLSDKEALEVKNLYPLWKEGIDVKVGERYGLNDKLYQVAQEHTTQENWRPDKMSSLWFEVSYHEGTKDDPIPFNEENDPLFQGMLLELGKFYKQGGVVYECIRDSQGVKIVQDLAGLVDNYVKIAE